MTARLPSTPLAQSVERPAVNRVVAGSTPAGCVSKLSARDSLGGHHEVARSLRVPINNRIGRLSTAHPSFAPSLLPVYAAPGFWKSGPKAPAPGVVIGSMERTNTPTTSGGPDHEPTYRPEQPAAAPHR